MWALSAAEPGPSVRSKTDYEWVDGWFEGLNEDEVTTLFELPWRVGENVQGETAPAGASG